MGTGFSSGSTGPLPWSVWGVIVAYFPGPDFEAVLAMAINQLDGVIIWNNTTDSSAAENTTVLVEKVKQVQGSRSRPCRVLLTGNGKNAGLSIAYNAAMRLAREHGASWLVLLDQDSILEPGAVAVLTNAARDRSRELKIGSVSARNWELVNVRASPRRAIARLSRAHDEQEYRAGKLQRNGIVREVRSFTNSGSMLSISALLAVGGFDERLFLDAVDFGMAVRFREQGFRMFETLAPLVRHRQGEEAVLSILGARVKARAYSPVRTYYIVRDTMRFARLSVARQPGFVGSVLISAGVGTLGALALLPNRAERARRFVEGLRDGIRSIGSGPAHPWSAPARPHR